MTWSAKDEAQLAALTLRKNADKRSKRDCVDRAVDQWAFREMLVCDIVDALIDHATTIRKVLEPFDKELK